MNPITYPNFLSFLKLQSIPLLSTSMSFSVSRDRGTFEWSGSGLSAVFTQLSNLWNWEMYRMIFDIVRFNTFATDLLDMPQGEGGTSLQRYLDENGYSCAFRDNYLIVPLSLSSPVFTYFSVILYLRV
jgi:predicted NAD/FAD-binding protein